MSNLPWRPLGQADDEATALVEDVPPWMRESFWSWVKPHFVKTEMVPRFGRSFETFDVGLLRTAERKCRFSVEYRETGVRDGMALLRRVVEARGEELRLADFLLTGTSRKQNPTALDLILVESGSAWKVGTRDGHPGLERRVAVGVQEAAEHAMREGGQAGQRLSQAWHAAFGLDPNPSHAYALAVKAVEDAAIPIVVPMQADASLGHVIGQLRKDGDWSLPLTREDPTAPTSEALVRLCQALWKGHSDRHGGDPKTPQSVDQAEAETAVLLAVPLVHWFTSGAVARR